MIFGVSGYEIVIVPLHDWPLRGACLSTFEPPGAFWDRTPVMSLMIVSMEARRLVVKLVFINKQFRVIQMESWRNPVDGNTLRFGYY